MKVALHMAKIILKQAKLIYIIVGILVLMGMINLLISELVAPGESISLVAGVFTSEGSVSLGAGTFTGEGIVSLGVGDYLYMCPILLSILVPILHFGKLMHLGGKRIDFFKSCILTYLPTVLVVTLIVTVLQSTLYPAMRSAGIGMFYVGEVFGFMARGPVIAFLQMFAFLLMLCCVLHTMTLIQGYWYGWVVDVLIVTIISVFTPIAPLRIWLVRFFNLIIFNSNVTVQILSCLVLGAVVYGASIIPIKSKRI
jgi:hypothetical protein